jgi:hypothetical protein
VIARDLWERVHPDVDNGKDCRLWQHPKKKDYFTVDLEGEIACMYSLLLRVAVKKVFSA